MTITLYDMHDSPHARKVRLLAAELGIPLKTIARDPRKGETRSPEYLAKNPNGRVPVLEEDGFVLWESLAILRYLAAKRPERALGGADPKSEGLVNQWLFW
jgi:glutathione S-transferase